MVLSKQTIMTFFQLRMSFQPLIDGSNSDGRRPLQWEPVDAGADRGKRPPPAALCRRQSQTVLVTASQQAVFPVVYRPCQIGARRVDDIPGGQMISFGDLGLTCSTPVEVLHSSKS